MSVKGRIHSIETCGTVDGPGIRFVLFMQGCPLRCLYCHNPDTWDKEKGREVTTDEIYTQIKKYKNYMNLSGGGVTITGGEPMLQPDFIDELIDMLKKDKISVAIDTSGSITSEKSLSVLKKCDLVLLDIKSYNKDTYKKLTGVKLAPTLKTMEYLAENSVDTWVRFVLVPDLTDNIDDITELAKYVSRFKNIKKIEVLPFHKLGEYKWSELDIDYQLSDTKEPTNKKLEEVTDIFRKYNTVSIGN
ncbi:MAG: pyruvate formate-lyase-activating protein [Eubacteriales bacterium]